ncbi:MAG: Crp/Fnr family transcriptional regulator [Polaromonas sp.]|nr:Crp/Fnr family transcriptional regulator [Polaromonas sp.]
MSLLSAYGDDLYSHLTPALRSLALRGDVRSYPKKTLLINEGEEGDSLWVLLKGSVKTFSMDQSGREIIYGKVQAGDYFGEMSLDGGPRSNSVMTLEPCTCSVLSRSDVSEHLADEPEFAIDLLVQVIRRARAVTAAARNLALLDVYSRLVAVLEENIDDLEVLELGAVTLEPMTHQEIAGRVGASREMISRLLKDFERGGYIQMSFKRINLLKKLPPRW